MSRTRITVDLVAGLLAAIAITPTVSAALLWAD
jgi:hypothetical protein